MTTDEPDGNAVVVPAISAGSSVTCIRSLGRKGIDTIGVSEDAAAPCTFSKYCDETSRVPSPDADIEGYAEGLLDVARRPDVLTVVPLREPDSYVLSKHRERFAEHVATPWMPFDRLQTVQDRLALYETARSVDVRVPETAPVDEWDHWDETTVVKPRYSILVQDGAATESGPRFFHGDEPDGDEIEGIVDDMAHVPMAQEYVPGDQEHGFFAVCDRGEPVATFQHRRVRSFNYAGGASTFRKSVAIPELERAGTRLLRGLDWHGPAMVEFKRHPETGAFVLMEINPRFWGSLALPYNAGVDFPYYYYRLARGDLEDENLAGENLQAENPAGEYLQAENPAGETPDYDVDVGCHLLRGELSYLLSVATDTYEHVERPSLPRETVALLRSLATDPNFDYLDVDDVRPFVRDVTATGRELLGSG